MLINFRTCNYASFKDPAELSMLATNSEMNPDHVSEIDGLRILRASAIYGANASGKSNLIRALVAMKRLVVYDTPVPSDRFFRSDPAMENGFSYFEVELEINGSVYKYSIEYLISAQEVRGEWFYSTGPDGIRDIFFTRIGRVITHDFSDPDGQVMDIYAEDAAQDLRRPFISVMGRRARPTRGQLAVFNDIYDWFDRGLVIVDADLPFSPDVAVSDGDLEELDGMISSFGTGVDRVVYERKTGLGDSLPQPLLEHLHGDLGSGRNRVTPEAHKRYASVGRYRASMDDGRIVLDGILYRHDGESTSYGPEEESDGTRKLYGLLVSMFLGRDDATFVVDDLDAHLHPQVAYRLVDMFLKCGKRRGSQMIFSTHESSLLDFDLLRRDEIWFVEKSRFGGSRLYSLEEFNERYDRRIEKAYREGRYGGLPIFSSVSPDAE